MTDEAWHAGRMSKQNEGWDLETKNFRHLWRKKNLMMTEKLGSE